MIQKKCTQCGLIKPIEDFRYLKSLRRCMAECKECERERRRKHARPSRRQLAVREVVFLCKMFDVGILSEAVNQLAGENNET